MRMAGDSEQPFEQEHGKRDETVQLLAQGQRVFNRYRLIRVLGRGGMGVVWLARDEELERDVALKFLPESICHDREAAADLKRETRRSLDLTHPNIVRIYDFVHDDDRAAIAMEHIDGRTLSALKVERPGGFFEVADITPWVQQLCAALDYAHSVGRVVHQDLKPANLMLNSKGHLKITDFGIARSIADSVTRVTAEDTVGGTLLFMSPQQLNGEKPSPANDIYSLGATLYDLLTGKPPFHTGGVQHQIENKVPPPMAERRNEFNLHGQPIPEAWENTVAACLAKRAADRPASAAEVADRLGLHQSPGKAAWMTRLPGRTRGGHFKPLPPWPRLTGVLVLVGLAALAFVFREHVGKREDAAPTSGKPSGIQTNIPTAGKGQSEPNFDDSTAPRLLPAQLAGIAQGRYWENSLGMRFVPLGSVGFSVWETRVRDFAEFVRDTGHDASAGVASFSKRGWAEAGHNWESPGFTQTGSHPVTCVNWHDAAAFCRWLTERERKSGLLTRRQRYRLPNNGEWKLAVGESAYPWGDSWPPAPVAANLAGAEVLGDHWPADRGVISGYDDGHPFTAPVGSFPANALGIHDLAGNVWEWGLDWSDTARNRRVFRGAAWDTPAEAYLRTDFFHPMEPTRRNTTSGFRCVLEEVGAP